jgi:hypothetical protein
MEQKRKRSVKAEAPPQSATERGKRLEKIVGSKASARITPEWLESLMDRPPDPKPKRWKSICCEEARIEACYLRYSVCWPICMDYPCLTIGVLGLTRRQALEQGMRLAEDQGPDTLVLDDDNWPIDLLQTHVSRLLGMRKQNVSPRVDRMIATKRYRREGKRVYIVSSPPALTPEEREKVIQTDYFLDLKVIQTDYSTPHLRKKDKDFLLSIPDLEVRTDYFRRFAALEADYLSEQKVLREKHNQARKVIRDEGSILIVSVSHVFPVPESSEDSIGPSSSSSGSEVEKATTTTITPSPPIPEPEPIPVNGRAATATVRAPDPEIVEVREAMEAHVRPVDLEAAATLTHECRKQDPEATIPEITQVIHAKGPLAARKDSPVGFLLTVVPKCFAGRVMRARPPESPPSRAFDGPSESYGEFKQRWARERDGPPPSFEEWMNGEYRSISRA